MEDNLSQLETNLEVEASPFFNYLRSIRNLHRICTARELENYNLAIRDFKCNFDHLYNNFGLNMTLKVHIIFHHYEDYFDWTGVTLRYTNGEFVESSHSSIKKEERCHGFKVVRKMGTPVHKQKALQSLIWHNSKRAGFTPSSKFRLRISSPHMSPFSSPSSSSIQQFCQ